MVRAGKYAANCHNKKRQDLGEAAFPRLGCKGHWPIHLSAYLEQQELT